MSNTTSTPTPAAPPPATPDAGSTGVETPTRSSRFALPAALLLGLICQVLVVLWIINSEIPGKVFISSWSVSMPGILLMALLLGARARLRAALLGMLGLVTAWNVYVALNAGVAISPFGLASIAGAAILVAAAQGRAATFIKEAMLERRALLTAYIMVAVSGILTGYGALQLMAPAVGVVVYRATPENNWARFHQHLSPWLFPQSPDALKGMFSGQSTVPWGDWLVPLCGWMLFLCAACGAMLCLSAILSPQWISGERLTFPVAQLPLEMTTPEGGLFRNRLLWFGFAIPLVLESLIALNYYFPAVPAIEIKHRDMQPFWFPERPFSVMKPFYWGWTPFIVGFAYLAPVDVSFSVWFFNLLAKSERVWGVAAGWDAAGGGVMANRFPYPEEQAFGAFLAFALAALWRTWPGIRQAWQERHQGSETSRVMLGSLAGLAVCIGILLAMLGACGLPLPKAAVWLTLLLLLAVTLSRIRAEAGPAWVFGPYRDVTRAMMVSMGSNSFSEREIVALSTFRWSSLDVRFLPMPFHMEAFKIADAAGIRKRTAMGVMALATVVGVVLGFIAVLTFSYNVGLATGKTYGGPIGGGTAIWNQANDWAKNHTMPDQIGIPWILGGAAFTLFLLQMRSLFTWWPFHPIGYVMAETGAGGSFWFHYMLAWLGKLVVLRYGGHQLYVRSLPFVIGLILGDLLTQTVWSAFAVLFGLPVYQFIS